MKIKVKALKPHMRHAAGAEYTLPEREAKVLQGLGYVEMAESETKSEPEQDDAPRKRTYKRRDMKAE